MAAQLKMVDGKVVIVPGFEEDTEQQIMSGPRGGVAGLLGGSKAAELLSKSKSEGIYDAGKGGNWFEEMFLKRTGGGGQDYMIPAEAKERDLTEIMTIGPRDDLKAKKIEAKRMNFFGKMIEGLDRLYEEDRETFFEAQRLWDVLKKDLSNGTNESGLNPRGYRDTVAE